MKSKSKPLHFPINKADLVAQAIFRLKADDVIGLPTETVYGLAARIGSEIALKKIFTIKERPFFDPLIVHVSSFKQAQSLVKEWSPLADFLARTFWPGPLTLIFPKNENVNSLITSGLETVAIRYPAHLLAQELITRLGEPVAAPSANKFGKTSPSSAKHVQNEFPEILVLNGGACKIGLESTVCSVDAGAGLVQILRPGTVTFEKLTEALKKWSAATRVEMAESSASPGHLKHHYMPAIPVFILAHPGAPTAMELSQAGVRRPTELALNPAAELAARNLYSDLRKLAESGADGIYVHRLPNQIGGYWDAIWDRLDRAASISF